MADDIRIVPREADGPVELSFAENRLWYVAELPGGSAAYNIPLGWRLQGPLNLSVLEDSFQELIRRQQALRSTFQVVEGNPVLVVLPAGSFKLGMADVTTLPEDQRESEARRLMYEDFRKPFDLTRDLMLRVLVVKLGHQDYFLGLTIHHIVADVASVVVIYRELEEIYSALLAGKAPNLPELPIQAVDYGIWQRKRVQGGLLENQLSYWKRQLSGLDSAELPTDRPRPPIQSYAGHSEYLEIDPELTAGVKKLARQAGVTVYLTLLATLQLLLHRYSGQEDIVIGAPYSQRREEIVPLIGMFINIVALRTDFSGDPTVKELLKRVRTSALGAYENQDVPFEKVVDAVRPSRDLSRNPLFQVLLIQQDASFLRLKLTGVQDTWILVENGTSKFDLSVYVAETSDRVVGWLEYNSDLFDSATIHRLWQHYLMLLRSAVADPTRRVSALPMLSEPERQQVLVDWNATEAEYPANACIHQLFEKQAEKYPKDTALVFEGEQVSYGELNRRANQVAHHLGQLGVGPEVPVALCMERGVDMVVALLGILKAGGAYIPLDPAYPKTRLAFMLEDAKPPVLVTQQSLLGVVPEFSGHVFRMDGDKAELRGRSTENPGISQSPETLAYIIYTSGSTGVPKGVQLSHRAVANLLTSMGRKPGLTRQDRLLAVTSLSFDIAGLELFLPLINGACLIVVSHETAADGVALQDQLKRSKATVMQATPATWHMLLEAGWKGDRGLKVLCGGEALPRDLAAALIPRVGSLWNMYGPTETCIWSSTQLVGSADGPILIGRPIDNTQFYLLDRAGQPVPAGVIGELHIGGEGVARGYLNRPELTGQKFVPDPFSAKAGARMFRTGDLGKFLADGTVQLLGRADDQVKIRGFRIELGEIETALAKMPGVNQAVVVAAGAGAAKRLVAHVIPDPGAAIGNAEVRRFLQDKLPEYMLPSACVTLEAFPLTPNGKIDRRTLAAMDVQYELPQADFVAPRDMVERQVAQIWEKILNVKPVGVTQNFFDLGGHSLLAVTVLRNVEKTFGKKLPLVALFQAPTVEGFARIIRDSGWSAPPVIAVQPKGSKPPFFCVYDRFDYGNLETELGDDQPLYVLPFDEMFDKQMKRGFVDVAQEFVSRMRTVQPEGPYYLGGMCLGARIAFAIASELYKQGETVGVLAIIDSPAPGYRSAIKQMSRMERLRFSLLDDLQFEWEILKRLNSRQKIEVIGETIKLDATRYTRRLKWRLTKKWYRHLGREVPVARRDSFHLMREAMGDYCPPEPYPGKVTLFRPTERPGDSYRDIEMGWRKIPIGELEVHQIPGRHIEMLRKPNVEILGGILSECLRKAQEKPTPAAADDPPAAADLVECVPR